MVMFMKKLCKSCYAQSKPFYRDFLVKYEMSIEKFVCEKCRKIDNIVVNVHVERRK